MSQSIILAIAAELGESSPPPYLAPFGKVWQKTPDEYDAKNDMVWESGWELVCKSEQNFFETKKTQTQTQIHIIKTETETTGCKWGCPNGHMGSGHYCYEREGGHNRKQLEEQRKAVALTFNPDYHVCNHETHQVCSGSRCCDLFWHDGQCHFVSDDGKCGYAVRYGNQ